MRSIFRFSAIAIIWLSAAVLISAQDKQLVDNYGDPLPKGALARIGTVRFTHGTDIRAVFIAPDDKTIKAVDDHGIVRVWEVATGRELRRFSLVGLGDVGYIILSPDRKKFVGNLTNGVGVWDSETGKPVRIIKDGIEDALVTTKSTFSSDGKLLIVPSKSASLLSWDITTGKKAREIKLEKPTAGKIGFFYLHDFCLSANLIAVADVNSRHVNIWRTTDGKLIRTIKANSKHVRGIRISPNGKRVAVGGFSALVEVFEVTTGKLLHQFKDYTSFFFRFLPDNQSIVLYSLDNEFHIYGLSTGKLRSKNFAQSALAYDDLGAVLESNGKILVGHSQFHRLMVWDLATRKLLGKGSDAPIPAMWHWARIVPDGQSLILTDFGSYDPIAFGMMMTRRYTISNGRLKKSYGGILLDVSQNSKYVATLLSDFGGGILAVYDAETGKKLWTARANESHTCAEFCDGGTKVVYESEKNLIVADARTGRELKDYNRLLFQYANQAVLGNIRDYLVTYSNDLKYVGTAPKNGGSARLFEWKTGKIVPAIKYVAHGRFAFSPKSDYLVDTGSRQKTILLRSLPSGKEIGRIGGYDFAGFQAEGQKLRLHADKSVLLWDVKAQKFVAKIETPDALPRFVRFSPDNKFAVVPKNKTANIVELLSGKVVNTIAGTRSQIFGLEYGTSHKMFMTHSKNNVMIWDTTGHQLALRSKPMKLDHDTFAKAWKRLASKNAAVAYKALWRLVASSDQAVKAIEEVLTPTKVPTNAEIAKLINDLNSAKFTIRKNAAATLTEMESALPALRNALKKKLTLESKRRIEKLIAELENVTASPLRLTQYRAIQVLEYIGTSAARKLLKRLAEGPESVATREATAALERMSN